MWVGIYILSYTSRTYHSSIFQMPRIPPPPFSSVI